MTKRQPISKALRFEVFKRDKFTCQYCGRSAPDVILQIDHIHPVAKGGDNDILNLITSCADCNSGKRDKTLSDDSVIIKRKAQLELLQERREQLDMLFQWQYELTDLDNEAAQRVAELFFEHIPGKTISDYGLSLLKGWIKKFGLRIVIESTQKALANIKKDKDGNVLNSGEAFESIPKIAGFENSPNKKIYYIRGIARKRFSYCDPDRAFSMLYEIQLKGADMEYVQMVTAKCRCWSEWRNFIEEYSSELDGK